MPIRQNAIFFPGNSEVTVKKLDIQALCEQGTTKCETGFAHAIERIMTHSAIAKDFTPRNAPAIPELPPKHKQGFMNLETSATT